MATITVTYEIQTALCKDLLITAIEGGINYWGAVKDYDPENGTVKVWDEVEPSTTVHVVDVTTIERGIQILLEGYADTTAAKNISKSVANYPSGKVFFDFDASDADCVLQCGIFGEIIYG